LLVNDRAPLIGFGFFIDSPIPVFQAQNIDEHSTVATATHWLAITQRVGNSAVPQN
jgi:hypothetical protein